MLSTLSALLGLSMLATCNIASAQGTTATQIFGYPNGFAGASGVFSTAGVATFTGTKLQLTSTSGAHQSGEIWYRTPVNVQAFTTNFSFQLPPNGTVPSIQGLTFCIQNSNEQTNPDYAGNPLYAAGDANLVGYGAYVGQYPIGNSIAIKFDLNSYSQFNWPTGGHPNSTGLYINGGPQSLLVSENDLNPYGINLYSGHVFSGTIVYDGTVLTMTLLDTSTNAQARYVWPINIPAVTLSNTAYVGFTSAEVNPANQYLLTWSYSSGYNTRLATPTFSVTPGSYPSAQTVAINGPAGATVYYTTNGLLPTTSSLKYTGPITVSANEVIQAVAVQAGYSDSSVALANYQIAAPGSPTINFPTGFGSASNLITTVGYSYINGSSIELSDTKTLGTAGAAWYVAPVNVQTFSTSFTLQFTSSNSNGTYGLGTTFCIQNQPVTTSNAQYGYVSGGPTALSNNDSSLGYGTVTPGVATGTTGGLLNSIAVKFDLSDNSTGLYKNGALPTSPEVKITGGVSLTSGHPLNATLAYNGTTLMLTIKDTVTNASFTQAWTIDIPGTVGANTAYVGFTASSGYFSANQLVQSWTYATTPGQTAAVPQAPTNLRVQ